MIDERIASLERALQSDFRNDLALKELMNLYERVGNEAALDELKARIIYMAIIDSVESKDGETALSLLEKASTASCMGWFNITRAAYRIFDLGRETLGWPNIERFARIIQGMPIKTSCKRAFNMKVSLIQELSILMKYRPRPDMRFDYDEWD